MKNSSLGLLIAVAVVYVPILILMVFNRRAYTDVFVAGMVVSFFCLLLNWIFPPAGMALFLTVHIFGVCLWIRSLLNRKPEE
jgi:TRAP-type C4-dicarboxylate transport system permease large subunit